MSRNNAGIYSEGLTSGTEKVAEAAETVAKTISNTGSTVKQGLSDLMTRPGNMFQSGVRVFFYLAVGALAIFLLLTFIHYTVTPVFSFTPGDGGILPIVPTGPKQYAFMEKPAANNMAPDFTDLYAFNTAYAFDLYVSSEFSKAVPRVIWYKANAYVTMDTNITANTLQAQFPESNLVLYMDSAVNDLKAMIVYQDSNQAIVAKHETCVENIPLRTPVRIGVIVFQKFVEIYMNGKLVRTISGNGNLIVNESSGKYIFGPPALVADSVKIARLTYWPYLISPQIMRLDAAEPKNPALFAQT